MKLQNFVRDNAYYSVLRDRDRTINAEDLDKQFTILQKFINTKVIPVVDGLTDTKLAGSKEPSDLECYLQNIGDKNTRWSKIRLDGLEEEALPRSALQKALEGCTLATGANGVFTTVALDDTYQFFTSRIGSLPSWEFLQNNHFALRSIDGSKVDYQTIGVEHLAEGVIGDDIDDNSIQNPYIAEGAVTGAKIAIGAIDDSKIDPELIARRNADANFADRSINAAHLRNNTLNDIFAMSLFFGSFAPNANTLTVDATLLQKITQIIPDNGIELAPTAKIYPQYHIADTSIQLRHIKLQSFSFTNLHPNPATVSGDEGYYNYLQFLLTEHLSPRLKQLIGLK